MRKVSSEIDVLSIDGGAMKASISQDKLSKLFDLLQSPYSDPISSIVRETSTNSWDAHVEAGVTEPILIKFDSSVNEGFSIEFIDYGVGMSPERIRKVYLNYLESTKENTNEQSGYFGIGSKSPLSYSDDYYITTVFDGIVYEYMVRKDSDGIPTISLLSEENTSERNGTTIKLYVKNGSDMQDFVKACRTQLKYFEHVYIVNNSGLYLDYNNKFKIVKGDNFVCRLKDNEDDTFSISEDEVDLCIGQVKYPINEDLLLSSFSDEKKKKLQKIIKDLQGIGLLIPIGSVSITMTRETIKYNEDTKSVIIKTLIHAYKEVVKKNVLKMSFDLNITDANLTTEFPKLFDDSYLSGKTFAITSDMIPVSRSFNTFKNININGNPFSINLLKKTLRELTEKSFKIRFYNRDLRVRDVVSEYDLKVKVLSGTYLSLYAVSGERYRVLRQDFKNGALSTVLLKKTRNSIGSNRFAFVELVAPENTKDDINLLFFKYATYCFEKQQSHKDSLRLNLENIFIQDSHFVCTQTMYDRVLFQDDLYVDCYLRFLGKPLKGDVFNFLGSKQSYKKSTLDELSKKYMIIGYRKSLNQDDDVLRFYNNYLSIHNIKGFFYAQLDATAEEKFISLGFPTVNSIAQGALSVSDEKLKIYKNAFNVINEDFYEYSRLSNTFCMQLYKKSKNYNPLISKLENIRYDVSTRREALTPIFKEQLFKKYPEFDKINYVKSVVEFFKKFNDFSRITDNPTTAVYLLRILGYNYFNLNEIIQSKLKLLKYRNT